MNMSGMEDENKEEGRRHESMRKTGGRRESNESKVGKE